MRSFAGSSELHEEGTDWGGGEAGGRGGTGKRERDGTDEGVGGLLLLLPTSKGQRAGQAPEGDISLQLCRDLLLFTVLCATAGLLFTLANGFSSDRRPGP